MTSEHRGVTYEFAVIDDISGLGKIVDLRSKREQMARPIAKLEYKVGSGDATKRYEVGQIWPGKEKADGGNWPASMGFVAESKLDDQYPQMAFTEAMAKVAAKEGFINLVTPKGFVLACVPEGDEEEDF